MVHLELAPLLLAGCLVGTGDDLNRWGRPLDEGGFTNDPFYGPHQVFLAHCVRCHYGPGAPRGLDLSLETSDDFLVGVPSSEVPEMVLVAPGSPDDSYLWTKLSAADERRQGARMPRDGPPYLDDGPMSEIRTWIEELDVSDTDLLP